MNRQNDEETQWLPLVKFGGIEYVVDIGNRQFRQSHGLGQGIGFQSEAGRAMEIGM